MAHPSATLVVWLVVVVALLLASSATAIGVNWGRMSTHPINPDIVARLLKDNGVDKVKLFDCDPWTVNSLANTGIEVMVAIPNNQLEYISESYDNAVDWVAENVTAFVKNGVKIKNVGVGNEPFLKSYNGSFLNKTLPSLKNIQNALDDAGHGSIIKATVPLNADVYQSPDNLPSTGQWRHDIRHLMTKLVTFLYAHNAPFTVNIYPFISLYQNRDFPEEYAFFEHGAKPINDNGNKYYNAFDANYDTLVSVLNASGFPDMKIIVGEVGWPTDGDKVATTHSAEKFYKGFIKRWVKDEGTPLRPGHLDVYLFSLFDENTKSVLPGSFERHWGIFTYDGKPKFPIDLAAKGKSDSLPIAAKGIKYLPTQWCVYNDEAGAKSMSTLDVNVKYACSLGDCTALGYGSSCNGMDNIGNVSYAFNMYFQMQDQDVRACDFNGLAKLTTVNASKDGCNMPIMIVSAGHEVVLVMTKFVVMVFGVFLLLVS